MSRILWLQLDSGKRIRIEQGVCPVCLELDANLDVDVRGDTWIVTDSRNHKWAISPAMRSWGPRRTPDVVL